MDPDLVHPAGERLAEDHGAAPVEAQALKFGVAVLALGTHLKRQIDTAFRDNLEEISDDDTNDEAIFNTRTHLAHPDLVADYLDGLLTNHTITETRKDAINSLSNILHEDIVNIITWETPHPPCRRTPSGPAGCGSAAPSRGPSWDFCA